MQIYQIKRHKSNKIACIIQIYFKKDFMNKIQIFKIKLIKI